MLFQRMYLPSKRDKDEQAVDEEDEEDENHPAYSSPGDPAATGVSSPGTLPIGIHASFSINVQLLRLRLVRDIRRHRTLVSRSQLATKKASVACPRYVEQPIELDSYDK